MSEEQLKARRLDLFRAAAERRALALAAESVVELEPNKALG